jgi:pyruvate/2-oxoglutarate dehydrogenase complex dihydrolipoamide dehydrogenase (E3) component
MARYDYNVIVVGGGTAGLISAYVANLLGAKTALIEANEMGGDCLNSGCVPSKSLIASARVAANISSSDAYGVESDLKNIDYGAVHSRVHQVIDGIAPADSAQRYRSLGVEVIEKEAQWVNGHTLKVGQKTITARRIIIATGSRPKVLDIPGAELSHVKTSDDVWGMKTQPKDLVVIGGGPIGVELSMAYAQLGSRVTIVEHGPTILSMLTDDQRQVMLETFKKLRVAIFTNSDVTEITKKEVILNGTSILADTVIMATGRTPNTAWLKDSPVSLDSRGYIKVNPALRTNVSSVYACGDVIGGFQFTHVAGYEAGYAGSNASLDWTFFTRKPRYNAIPWSIYTTPEVAHVGRLVKDAAKDDSVTHVELNKVDRAKTDGKTEGGIWLISSKKGRVLGVTIIGSEASSLIGQATLAVSKKLSVNDLFTMIDVYPSYGDIYGRVAGKWKQARTHQASLEVLKRITKLVR